MGLKRSPIQRRTRLRRGKSELKARKRIPTVNRARRKKLRAEQFGVDGYYDHVVSSPCLVTGARGVDPAHILGTRAAGHGPEGMGPLRRDVHTDYDSMGEERFRLRWGVSKEWVRDRCREFRVAWCARDLA